ncbi:MAG: DNA replication/repair protein RecF [Beijerinckiaceae bacterium]
MTGHDIAAALQRDPGAPVAIRRLVLADFRSYAALDLLVHRQMVIVTGENGSGKTNLLEAISLLSQGRGLRRAELAACARAGGSGGFAISAELETASGMIQFGTGYEPGVGGQPATRRYRVDREPVGSARAFATHLRMVWLTPAMDSLFNGPPGDRRRFLDRLVLAVDAGHGTRVAALERALRQRNRVLEDGPRADRAWLEAIEREVAELAVAVAAARTETVARLGQLIAERRDEASPFPWADVRIEGDVEKLCATYSALEAEDRYRAMLRDNRARDASAGRTLNGPQASDLLVRHGPKNIEAGLCSTGEQKALLTGLVIAHARLVAALSGLAPLILLDEITAHFDSARRLALFETLAEMPAQVWMTGADVTAFAPALDRAQVLRVEPGRVIEG